MKKDWLEEQIKTTRNLCNIVLILIKENRSLLPTVLELLFIEVAQILDEQCIERDK